MSGSGRKFHSKGGLTIGKELIKCAFVVTKNVDDYAIVAGNPARLIRYRLSNPDVREKIGKSKGRTGTMRNYGAGLVFFPILRPFKALSNV
jgi:hypothetical protein